jgi:hypothetical protein
MWKILSSLKVSIWLHEKVLELKTPLYLDIQLQQLHVFPYFTYFKSMAILQQLKKQTIPVVL